MISGNSRVHLTGSVSGDTVSVYGELQIFGTSRFKPFSADGAFSDATFSQPIVAYSVNGQSARGSISVTRPTAAVAVPPPATEQAPEVAAPAIQPQPQAAVVAPPEPPLSRSQRSQGLAAPEAPSGTLVAYATASGNVASDGYGDHSPYVAALLRHLRTADLEMRHMFGKVQDDVARATDNAQVPTLWDSLGGEQIFLVPKAPEPAGLALAELTSGEVRAIQRSLGWLGYWTGAEDGRVSIRNIRRHAKETLDRLARDGEVGEDDVARAEKQLEAVTKKYVDQVDDLLKHKEAELLEV